MITANFHDVTHFTIDGHADFDLHGKDIVCAGISAMVHLTIKGLQKHNDVEVEQYEGYTDVYVTDPSNISKSFIYALFYSLKDIAMQYPDNLKLKGVKVL